MQISESSPFLKRSMWFPLRHLSCFISRDQNVGMTCQCIVLFSNMDGYLMATCGMGGLWWCECSGHETFEGPRAVVRLEFSPRGRCPTSLSSLQASSFEEEILPFRRRHSELTAENRRLGHRIRSLEVQLEYANRIIKNGNGKGSMGRSSFPAHDLDASCNGRVPPFPTEEPSDAWQPSTIGALPMNPTEAHRISELQRRNCVQPDHMKTSYPVETQVCDPKEVAEILGSSSTTTVVRHSLPAPNSSAFTTSESFAATMRPEVLSPPRLSATNSNRNRPSSTPLVLQDLNVNGSRLSPVPQREHKFCTAFEIQNTPKQATDLRSSSRSRRGARPKSFQAS